MPNLRSGPVAFVKSAHQSVIAVSRLAVVFLLLALATGCKTIPQPATAAFATGVTAAREQTDLAFKAVNELAADSIFEFAVSQPTLNEKNFFVVLEPAAIASWDKVFDAMEKYSQSLVVLTSPNLTDEFRKSALELAQQITTTGERLKDAHLVTDVPAAPPGLATAVTKIGEILLRAKAHADARAILVETDPQIQQVFTVMADAIGTGSDTGIRGTVKAHWTQIKGEKQVAFLNSTPPEKRRLATEFADLLQQQRAQDMALAALRRSLLSLAAAHHALAAGQDLSVSAAVAQIQEEIKDTKNLYAQFETIAKKAKNP